MNSTENMNTQKQATIEERFIKWAEARDDDWWEDQARISIWDFRIMNDFFKEELDSLAQEVEKMFEEYQGLEPIKDQVLQLIRERGNK